MTTPLADFDSHWDYHHPAQTERVFRELLPAAEASGNADYLAQLLTQIARCQGLQRRFTEAHETLDRAAGLITPDLATARVRLLLERGRVFNSSGQADLARALFEEAYAAARKVNLDGYAVDAAHMLAIVVQGEASLRWNETALALAEGSSSEETRRWLPSLYNNLGWTYHDGGDYGRAIDLFQKALALRQARGQARETRIARWCVARCLRSLGRLEEALAMQESLFAEVQTAGEQDGYVLEELGECLLALGRQAESVPHFGRAWELLSADPWLADKEPQRLARLNALGIKLQS